MLTKFFQKEPRAHADRHIGACNIKYGRIVAPSCHRYWVQPPVQMNYRIRLYVGMPNFKFKHAYGHMFLYTDSLHLGASVSVHTNDYAQSCVYLHISISCAGGCTQNWWSWVLKYVRTLHNVPPIRLS